MWKSGSILALAIVSSVHSVIQAETKHWTKDGKIDVVESENRNGVRAAAHLKREIYTDDEGKKKLVVEVRMETKIRKAGTTGRGYAIYTAFNKNGQPVHQIVVKKYCTTNINDKSKDCGDSKKADWYYDKFMDTVAYHTLEVHGDWERSSVFPPETLPEIGDWLERKYADYKEFQKKVSDSERGEDVSTSESLMMSRPIK